MQNHLVHHLIGTKLRCAPKCTSVQSYTDIGPPCWCTTQPGGAQCRSMVHSVVLYSQDGAQCRSYKHRQTDMTSSINFDTWCKREKLLEMFHLEMSIVSAVAKWTYIEMMNNYRVQQGEEGEICISISLVTP